MRFATLSSTVVLVLYTASVSAAPIHDTNALAMREAPTDVETFEAREGILDEDTFESRDLDEELTFEARARKGRKAPAGKRPSGKANGAKRGGRPVQQNKPGRQNKLNGSQNGKPNKGRQNGKPNNGRQNSKSNRGGPPKKSFLSSLGAGLKKTGRWINRNRDGIKQSVSGAAQIAGTAANAYVDIKAQQGKTSRLGNVMQVVNAVQQGQQ